MQKTSLKPSAPRQTNGTNKQVPRGPIQLFPMPCADDSDILVEWTSLFVGKFSMRDRNRVECSDPNEPRRYATTVKAQQGVLCTRRALPATLLVVHAFCRSLENSSRQFASRNPSFLTRLLVKIIIDELPSGRLNSKKSLNWTVVNAIMALPLLGLL